MKPTFVMLCATILLTACSDSKDVMEELPNSSIAGAAREAMTETQIESALARPVSIGEDGSELDACGGMGIVRGLGAGRTLAMRSAPFQNAKAIAQLPNGARVHICTRSLDQRWLGVVVPPPAPPPAQAIGGNVAEPMQVDCGVSSPVDRKQAYDGPCQSGWIASGLVQLIAG